MSGISNFNNSINVRTMAAQEHRSEARSAGDTAVGFEFSSRAPHTGPFMLGHPLRQKHVKFTRHFRLTIGDPDYPFAVGRKHWEAVEVSLEGQPFKPSSIVTGQIEVKARSTAFFSGVNVRGKNDPFAVR